MKPPLATTIVWFFILNLLFICNDPLSEFMYIFYDLIRWGMILIGALLAVMACVTFSRLRLRSMIVLLLCVIGTACFYSVGFQYGRYVLFQMRKVGYEQQLTLAQEAGEAPRELGRTDDGPPQLFAFYWRRGSLDNWSAVIFDPTGDIPRINDAETWDEIHAHDLSRLFGGTYYRCQPVGNHWYICWFT